MIHELPPDRHEAARLLFQPLRFHLTSAAVLDGNSPGRIFVDHLDQPQAAFMVSPEGCYLVGDPDALAFIRALNQAVVRDKASAERIRMLFLIVGSSQWKQRLPMVFDPHGPHEMRRRHYLCSSPGYDWRAHLLDGCSVRRIDQALLDSSQLDVPDHVTNWMTNNWGSIGGFLRGGFGFVTILRHEIVSWSLADCVSREGCEIGIRTVSAHRRRGLAAITAAAAVEHALTHGFARVGWHCPTDNIGSIRTAEKVGFERERDYVAYLASLSE